jgi:hypothetical protein
MTDKKPSPKGYFLAIVCVVGGALLMPPFPVFFTITGLLLLLVLLCPLCLLPISLMGTGKSGGINEDDSYLWDMSRIIRHGNRYKRGGRHSKRDSAVERVRGLFINMR